MIIGWDGGYVFNKTSKGVIFPSKLSLFSKRLEKDSNAIEVQYKRKNYIIGAGTYETDLNKITKDSSKIFMLTSLALSSQYSEFEVVAGLPIQQYKRYKDELKNEILSDKLNFIFIGDRQRTIIINDAYVFPQCLASYYSLDESTISDLEYSDVLVVDIGGRTIDISLLMYKDGSRVVEKYGTILEGTLSLYSDFVHELNVKFELDLRVEDADRILRQGLYLGGIKQDLKFTRDIISSHLNEIYKELDLNYPVKTSALFLTGGGAYLYGELFNKRYSNIHIIDNAQFSNANGLERIGKNIWQK